MLKIDRQAVRIKKTNVIQKTIITEEIPTSLRYFSMFVPILDFCFGNIVQFYYYNYDSLYIFTIDCQYIDYLLISQTNIAIFPAMRIWKERANKIFFKHNISPYKIQPERSAKRDRGRTGRNSPRTPFPPRLHSLSGTGKAYKKIREYIYGLPVLIRDCKSCIGLFFKGLKIWLRIFFKKSSNFGQKAQPLKNLALHQTRACCQTPGQPGPNSIALLLLSLNYFMLENIIKSFSIQFFQSNLINISPFFILYFYKPNAILRF